MKLEQSELQESNDASLSSNVSARVSFTTRRSAERAFVQGKTWQGHKLEFLWVKSVHNPGKEVESSNNLPAASSGQSDVKSQPSEDDASTDNFKISFTGSDEPENQKTEGDADSAEQEKDLKSASTSSSSEKQP